MGGATDELAWVLVNDQVIPLKSCANVDKLERCAVTKFVKILSFAAEGGIGISVG